MRHAADKHGLKNIPSMLEDSGVAEVGDLEVALVVKHQVFDAQVPVAHALQANQHVRMLKRTAFL